MQSYNNSEIDHHLKFMLKRFAYHIEVNQDLNGIYKWAKTQFGEQGFNTWYSFDAQYFFQNYDDYILFKLTFG